MIKLEISPYFHAQQDELSFSRRFKVKQIAHHRLILKLFLISQDETLIFTQK